MGSKNPHAQALGRLGGLANKGISTPAKTKSARKAIKIRWQKYRARMKQIVERNVLKDHIPIM